MFSQEKQEGTKKVVADAMAAINYFILMACVGVISPE
jgi:hypothetical protein